MYIQAPNSLYGPAAMRLISAHITYFPHLTVVEIALTLNRPNEMKRCVDAMRQTRPKRTPFNRTQFT